MTEEHVKHGAERVTDTANVVFDAITAIPQFKRFLQKRLH